MLLYLNSAKQREEETLCLKLSCSSLFFHFPVVTVDEVGYLFVLLMFKFIYCHLGSYTLEVLFHSFMYLFDKYIVSINYV